MIIKKLKIFSLNIDNTLESGYIITSIKGLENTDGRLPSVDYPTRHGGVLLNSLYATRKISLSIQVVGSDQADFVKKRGVLMREISIDRKTEIPIEITLRDGLTYKTGGMTKAVRENTEFGETTFGSVAVEFECYDPVIYSKQSFSETARLKFVGGGVGIPTEVPFGIGEVGEKDIASCHNGGNIKTCPFIMINGVCKNPRIKNITSGKALQFNVDLLNAADYISIDMKSRRASKTVGGVSSDIISDIDSDDKEWWDLLPGVSEVELTHEDNYTPDLFAIISWYNAFTGL